MSIMLHICTKFSAGIVSFKFGGICKYATVQWYLPVCVNGVCLQYETGTLTPTAITSLGKSKKLKSKAGAGGSEKVKLPVETDPHKLVNYLCGSNIQAEGGEDIKLKPDNEYPEWLWTLHIGKNKSLDELDPNTLDYWQKVRGLAIRRNHRLKKLKRF